MAQYSRPSMTIASPCPLPQDRRHCFLSDSDLYDWISMHLYEEESIRQAQHYAAFPCVQKNVEYFAFFSCEVFVSNSTECPKNPTRRALAARPTAAMMTVM